MSDQRDKKSDGNGPEAADGKRSGRVAFDSRGNSVWEWQVETGVYSRDVNTESVRKLELDELSLEDSAIRKADAQATPVPTPARNKAKPSEPPPLKIEPQGAGGGFNPYDNAASQRQRGTVSDPYDNARLRAESVKKSSVSASRATQPTPAAPRKPVAIPKSPPTEMRKLSGWLKLKQALLGKKSGR